MVNCIAACCDASKTIAKQITKKGLPPNCYSTASLQTKERASKSLTNEQAYFEKDCCDDSDDGKNDLAGRIKEPSKDQLTIDIHDV